MLEIALALPDTIKRNLQRLCFGLPTVEWTELENFYLSLFHIDPIDGARLLDIIECIEKTEFATFSLSLGAITVNNSKGNSGTLSVEIHPSENLKKLQKTLDKSLKELRVDHKVCPPHVILGKYKHLSPVKLVQYLEANTSFYSPPFEVDFLHILSWHKTPKRMIYRLEAKVAAQKNL